MAKRLENNIDMLRRALVVAYVMVDTSDDPSGGAFHALSVFRHALDETGGFAVAMGDYAPLWMPEAGRSEKDVGASRSHATPGGERLTKSPPPIAPDVARSFDIPPPRKSPQERTADALERAVVHLNDLLNQKDRRLFALEWAATSALESLRYPGADASHGSDEAMDALATALEVEK